MTLALLAIGRLILGQAALDVFQPAGHRPVEEHGLLARGGHYRHGRAAPAFDPPVKSAQGQVLAFGNGEDGFTKDLSHHRLGPWKTPPSAPALMALRGQSGPGGKMVFIR